MRLVYKLRVKRGPDNGLVYEIHRKETVIGRGEDCDLPLSDNEASRRHCKIVVKGKNVEVVDIGSTNGTRLNERMVDKSPVNTGDTIGLGDTELYFYSEEVSGEEPAAEQAGLAGKLASTSLAARIMGLGWSSKVITVLGLTAFIGYLIVAVPLISHQSEMMRDAGLDLSRVLVLSLGAANQEALRQGDEMLVNVKQLSGVEGVLRAYVYDLSGRTLAPISQLHKIPADPVAQKALAAKKVIVQHLGEDLYDLAAPIRVFSMKAGKFEKVGTARIVVSLATLKGLERGAWTSSLISLIFMLALAGVAGIFIGRLTQRPINDLRQELEAALKGDQQGVTLAKGFGSLRLLAESLNRALAKLNQAARPEQAQARPSDARRTRQELAALAGAVGRPVLVLDAANQVLFASPAFNKAAGAGDLEGRHLLEALTDKQLLAAILERISDSAANNGSPSTGAAQLEPGRELEITASSVMGPNGEPVAIALAFKGI